MNGLLRTPHERWLPAWFGVSVAMHVVVLAGGGAILADRAREHPDRPATRVLLAGRIIESLPETLAATAEPASAAPSYHPPSPTALRAAHDVPTSAMGGTPNPQTPPARAVGGFADGDPEPEQRHSASAPRLGRPGAAWAGPLAGGGAEALTTEGSPVGFQIAAAGGGGGTGPGYGGSGAGLGVGGSAGGGASGPGGGGTPDGSGLSSGGVGGGTSGQIDPGGSIGGGGTPGPGGGSSSGSSAPGGTGGGKSQPGYGASSSAAAPPTSSEPTPTPPPEPETRPDPPPEPRPSQADLSAFRSMVQSRISSARRYPQSARDAGQEGTVRVSFSVSPSGQPSGISVASSSGYQSLDAAARRAVSAAAPYRPFPKHMDSSIRVTATVIFLLN